MKSNIYACLLAGGKGTRLWPLSIKGSSKSFVKIGNRSPLIEEAINRLAGFVDKKHILVVVDKSQEKLSREFTSGIPGKNILVEPFGRSTASAVGLAAINLKANDVMVVLPTDALIEDAASFKDTIKEAAYFADSKKNALISIGISPSEATTAYGYIKPGKKIRGQVYQINRFTEKPSLKKAQAFLRSGNYLWNAGIFVFTAGAIMTAIKTHAPALYRELCCIKKNKKNTKKAYERMENVSIDYQIMEKAKNLYCVKGKFHWKDIGSWVSMGKIFENDKKKNAIFGKVKLIDTEDSIIYNSEKTELAVVGLKKVIVAKTKNGTLVSAKAYAEKIKELSK